MQTFGSDGAQMMTKQTPNTQEAVYHEVPAPPLSTNASFSFKYVWLAIVLLLVISSVGIGTYLLDGNASEQPLLNALVTPTPVSLNPAETANNKKDPTSDWLLYTNSVTGYTIKYPPNFSKPLEDPDRENTIVFSGSSGTYALITFPFEGTLEDLFEERSMNIVTLESSVPFVFSDVPTGGIRTALIDGSKAYWYETGADDSILKGREVHFITKGQGVIFRSESEQEVNEKEMEQMIMSFKNIQLAASESAKEASMSAQKE